MTEALRTAAQQALAAMDYMLNNGEWYQAQERADALRAALAQPAASGEPDMRHPKIQALIGSNARRNIELRLVEQLLDDPDCDLTSLDMEYWHGLHDKLRDRLQLAPARVPLTDEQIVSLWGLSKWQLLAAARAIEAAHGITAKEAPHE